jgi:hypothetical protein
MVTMTWSLYAESTRSSKKKYGVSGFSCICCRWKHRSCDADDGSDNPDPTAALYDPDEEARLHLAIRRTQPLPRYSSHVGGTQTEPVHVTSSSEDEEEEVNIEANVSNLPRTPKQGTQTPSANAPAMSPTPAAPHFRKTRPFQLQTTTVHTVPPKSISGCCNCGNVVDEGYLTSCGHLICTDPCLQETEIESKAQGRNVFNCPGCGNVPTSIDVFSPSMHHRVKPTIHREMPPPEVLNDNAPRKRLGETLDKGESKRQHTDKPLAPAENDASIAGGAIDGSFGSQDSDTTLPNVINTDFGDDDRR